MKKRLFWVIVTLQAIFLIAMAFMSYFIEIFGDVILLETEPYDPKDVFYGDYVHLNYEIEQIRSEYWFGGEDIKPNEVVYVLLNPDERGIYQVKAASDMRMDAHSDEVVIQARYEFQGPENIHHVNYGLNRYYIEEGTGEIYENSEKLLVTVAISPWGQKKILKVEVNDSSS